VAQRLCTACSATRRGLHQGIGPVERKLPEQRFALGHRPVQHQLAAAVQHDFGRARGLERGKRLVMSGGNPGGEPAGGEVGSQADIGDALGGEGPQHAHRLLD
jgi:hypothetical protein